MSTQATPAGSQDLIAAYKAILRDVLDRRPSGHAPASGRGARQEPQLHHADCQPGLSDADPGSARPSHHPDLPFLGAGEGPFLEAYHRAHPRRLLLLQERERSRRLTIMLPDLGSEQKNHKLDSLLSEFAEKVARLIEDS
jgi:hypothetical protein